MRIQRRKRQATGSAPSGSAMGQTDGTVQQSGVGVERDRRVAETGRHSEVEETERSLEVLEEDRFWSETVLDFVKEQSKTGGPEEGESEGQ